MSVEALIRAGDLDAALAAAKDAVRDAPAELKHRVLLFQLFAVAGDWERAGKQVQVAAELDPIAIPMAQTYGAAISCERFRAAVFAGERSPLVLGEPPEWIGHLIHALGHDARGEYDAASELRARAFDDAAATSGTLGDEPFEWLADADPRLGPVFELLVDGKYYWVPVERVQSLTAEAPEDLRDLVWMPVQVIWATGGEQVALMPTRYPGTEARSDDAALQLARKTDWHEVGGDLVVGVGQRLLATDVGETAQLDVRTIRLNTAVEAASADADGAATQD